MNIIIIIPVRTCTYLRVPGYAELHADPCTAKARESHLFRVEVKLHHSQFRTTMGACVYIIVVLCAYVLGGVDASTECSEPETQRGRVFCAIIARDNLCLDGTVSNETCKNCTELENYCGPLELNNDTRFCEDLDEESAQFCPLFRAVTCTGNRANLTDEQLQRCDFCLVVGRECTVPPPSVCNETDAQLACTIVEHLEPTYTCIEIFPPEEDDDGPCQLCEYYELVCGRPLDEVNATFLCSDDDIVVHCYIQSVREECTNIGDDPDLEAARDCAICSLVSNASCDLPPPTGDNEICNETELESFCATALGDQLCPGTTFAEETCETCLFFEVFCGPPEGDITDLCNATEAEETCSEIIPTCSMENIPEDNITLCDACRLRSQRCEPRCFDFELQLFCSLLETSELEVDCIELFPEEEEACAFCEDFQGNCGRPPEVNTTILCDDEESILYCFIANRGKCLKENRDQETTFNCSLCSLVDEECAVPPPTGDAEICSGTEFESFCATVLREELCRPGTEFAEETCDTCSLFTFFCGSPEGDIEDLCDESEAEEFCTKLEPVCTMNEVPRENVTLCDACGLREERCSGLSIQVVSLPVILAALLLWWASQD